ncbi:MAG TPA: tripartite tricarboxylate transporter substrate binding protein [Burkholderiales bacterium]|nr:tripartite tricarboxylate transporter substrate binding protein [Burkholderiales bacterium]
MRKHIMVLICATVAAHAAAAADTAQFPSKPIRMVVPFGAGSNSDLLARTVAVRMAEHFGQQVVVDNRPGAGGNIGTDLVAKAPPDGYTIVLGAASVLAINQSLYSQMPYDSNTAFAPITNMVKTTNVLIVTPALPVKTVNELIAFGKANPGKLTYASAGAGGTIHLSAELFKSMTGITMEHIAYKSSPLAHIDMISGQVHAMFDAMPTALPQVKANRLRAVAVTTAKRSPQLPDVPTVAESLPGFEAAGWFGFAAPARTPKEVVVILNKEIVRILALPEVKERLIAQGAEPVGDTPEQFAQYIKSEAAKWGKVIKTLNLKIE